MGESQEFTLLQTSDNCKGLGLAAKQGIWTAGQCCAPANVAARCRQIVQRAGRCSRRCPPRRGQVLADAEQSRPRCCHAAPATCVATSHVSASVRPFPSANATIYMDCLLRRWQGCEYRKRPRQSRTILRFTTARTKNTRLCRQIYILYDC